MDLSFSAAGTRMRGRLLDPHGRRLSSANFKSRYHLKALVSGRGMVLYGIKCQADAVGVVRKQTVSRTQTSPAGFPRIPKPVLVFHTALHTAHRLFYSATAIVCSSPGNTGHNKRRSSAR